MLVVPREVTANTSFWVRVTQYLVFCVVFSVFPFPFGHCIVCPYIFKSLLNKYFILLLAIVLSVLRFMDSDYPFGIFKLLLIKGLMEN
jgi:hypothetical protein